MEDIGFMFKQSLTIFTALGIIIGFIAIIMSGAFSGVSVTFGRSLILTLGSLLFFGPGIFLVKFDARKKQAIKKQKQVIQNKISEIKELMGIGLTKEEAVEFLEDDKQ